MMIPSGLLKLSVCLIYTNSSYHPSPPLTHRDGYHYVSNHPLPPVHTQMGITMTHKEQSLYVTDHTHINQPACGIWGFVSLILCE